MSTSSQSDPSLDLVGLAAAVESLDAVLDRLHHRGEALVFRGEPVIAKSALLKHASWRAAESGFRTLATVGGGDEFPVNFCPKSDKTEEVLSKVRALLEKASKRPVWEMRPYPHRCSMSQCVQGVGVASGAEA
jgi:hypothetical protein